jgi:signal transduction histidine kinase
MTVRSTVEGRPQPVPDTTQLTVYRVVQEATTNVLKHGQHVKLVDVRLVWSDTRLRIHITDDGTCTAAPPPGGVGLIGMRERVAAAGGTVTAGPRTAGGWQVAADLPLPTGAA